MPPGLDALRVPFVLYATPLARPDVLVLDRVAVFRRDQHVAMRERGADFSRPGLETGAVRGGGAVREHKVCEMAVFVREDVEKAVRVIDDLFRQLDGGVVTVCYFCCRGSGGDAGVDGGLRTDRLSFPVCAAGGGGELFGPKDVDAPSGGGEVGDLGVSDGSVEFLEEGDGEGVFLFVEESLRGDGLLVLSCGGFDGTFTEGSRRGVVG